MFLCRTLRKEPAFEADLGRLGLQYHDGRFLDMDGKYFNFFHSEQERSNIIRKEAAHEAVRKEVARELRAHDIQELFVGGDHGRNMSSNRPTEPHTVILTNEVSQLREKRDIIVVVGGSEQDAGIWAYRILMNEGGVNEGSAVGLAKKLEAYGRSVLKGKGNSSGTSGGTGHLQKVSKIENGISTLALELSIGAPFSHAAASLTSQDTTPGLIILNPGQLAYSYYENKPMSQPTWIARNQPAGNPQEYVIEEEHNRVKGHETPFNHIYTTLEFILPRLIRDDARVNIIAIRDSAPHVVDIIDQAMLNPGQGRIADQMQCIALVEPEEYDGEVASEAWKIHLNTYGRSFVEDSEKPIGELINTPEPTMPKPVVTSWTPPESAPDSRPTTPQNHSTAPPSSPASGFEGYRPHNRKSSRASGDKIFTFDEEGQIVDKTDTEDKAIKESEDGHHHLEASEGDESKSNANGSAGYDMVENTAAAAPSANFEDIATYGLPRDDDGNLIAEPENPLQPVLCPTFSAGDCGGISETVFPKVMDRIFAFFMEEKEEVEERRARLSNWA